MVRLLGKFVRAESPSFDKAAVDRFGRMVAAEWRRQGARVHVFRQRERGDHVRAELRLGSGRPQGQILVLGHLDTHGFDVVVPAMEVALARGTPLLLALTPGSSAPASLAPEVIPAAFRDLEVPSGCAVDYDGWLAEAL